MSESIHLPAAVPFWGALTQQEQEGLTANSRVQNFAAGDIIHDANQACIGVFIVLRGSARAYMISEEGRELTLFRINEQESCVLSASCVMPLITFDILVEAAEDTELLVIRSDYYGAIMQNNVQIEAYTYKEATTRFSEVMWVMQQQLFMRFDQRLAIFLLDEAARTGDDRINLTHEEIAKHVGSAREVVTRALKQFASEGLVEPFRGGLILLNKTELYNK